MAVTLRSLCETASYLYGMRVIAGSGGMSNIVQWVHTVEDIEVSGFLHGGELIFSTGIANRNQDWLLPFVKNLIQKQVSGLVLNIGPYITGIPKEVIDYCNKLNFPLMDIPWKTRIVDISRDFCNRIILNEREEEDISQALRNIVFFPGDADKYIPVLECHNFDSTVKCCMVAVKAEMAEGSPVSKSEDRIERLIHSYKKPWGGFKVDMINYYVLSGFNPEEIEHLVGDIQALQYNHLSIKQICISVGMTAGKLSELSKNYQITSRLFTVSQKKKISPSYYDKMGMKKILLAVDNLEVLKSFYAENLMKLKSYDKENGTDYMGFLRMYLEYDGSVQRVAEETFVHRNTINYQLAKVKKILGNDMKTLEDRHNLLLAFYIEMLI